MPPAMGYTRPRGQESTPSRTSASSSADTSSRNASRQQGQRRISRRLSFISPPSPSRRGGRGLCPPMEDEQRPEETGMLPAPPHVLRRERSNPVGVEERGGHHPGLSQRPLHRPAEG